jgi:hypothetical protein
MTKRRRTKHPMWQKSIRTKHPMWKNVQGQNISSEKKRLKWPVKFVFLFWTFLVRVQNNISHPASPQHVHVHVHMSVCPCPCPWSVCPCLCPWHGHGHRHGNGHSQGHGLGNRDVCACTWTGNRDKMPKKRHKVHNMTKCRRKKQVKWFLCIDIDRYLLQLMS